MIESHNLETGDSRCSPPWTCSWTPSRPLGRHLQSHFGKLRNDPRKLEANATVSKLERGDFTWLGRSSVTQFRDPIGTRSVLESRSFKAKANLNKGLASPIDAARPLSKSPRRREGENISCRVQRSISSTAPFPERTSNKTPNNLHLARCTIQLPPLPKVKNPSYQQNWKIRPRIRLSYAVTLTNRRQSAPHYHHHHHHRVVKATSQRKA